MKQKATQSANGNTALSMGELPEDLKIIARVIGVENAIELAKHLGGESIYIPKINCVLRRAMYRTVKEEFDGANYRELARKYGYTVRWIREIVKQGA